MVRWSGFEDLARYFFLLEPLVDTRTYTLHAKNW